MGLAVELGKDFVVRLGAWKGGGESVLGFLRGIARRVVFMQLGFFNIAAKLGKWLLGRGNKVWKGSLDRRGMLGNVSAYIADPVVT